MAGDGLPRRARPRLLPPDEGDPSRREQARPRLPPPRPPPCRNHETLSALPRPPAHGAHARGRRRQPDGLRAAQSRPLAECDHRALHPRRSGAVPGRGGAGRSSTVLRHASRLKAYARTPTGLAHSQQCLGSLLSWSAVDSSSSQRSLFPTRTTSTGHETAKGGPPELARTRSQTLVARVWGMPRKRIIVDRERTYFTPRKRHSVPLPWRSHRTKCARAIRR
jgi:hypothetical protein